MNTHPYLRAYLAGLFVPSLGLLLLLSGFVVVRLVFQMPVPIERGLVFPMALVPTLWGLWNMAHLCTRARTGLPIGLHGAILPLLIMPTGALLGSCLGVLALGQDGVTWFQNWQVSYGLIAPCFMAALAGYYLVWKYIVGFVNGVLGIA